MSKDLNEDNKVKKSYYSCYRWGDLTREYAGLSRDQKVRPFSTTKTVFSNYHYRKNYFNYIKSIFGR